MEHNDRQRKMGKRKRKREKSAINNDPSRHSFFFHPSQLQSAYIYIFLWRIQYLWHNRMCYKSIVEYGEAQTNPPLLFNWKPISHPSLKWYRICFYFHRKIIDAMWGEKSDGERRDKNCGFFLGFCIISIYAINLNKWKNIVVLATRWNQICENIGCVWVLVTKQHCRASLNVQELKSPFRVPCVGEYGYV